MIVGKVCCTVYAHTVAIAFAMRVVWLLPGKVFFLPHNEVTKIEAATVSNMNALALWCRSKGCPLRIPHSRYQRRGG